MKKILLVFLAVFSPALLFGQGVMVPPQSAFKVVNGVTTPIANATITVCAALTGGFPCSPPLVSAIFKDVALTQPLSNPFTADSAGNYQFAIAPGNYTVTQTALGFTGYSYQLTASSSSTTAGLADPGANGPVFRNGLNTTRPSVVADLIGLFSGTCNVSAYLRGDGSCAPYGFNVVLAANQVGADWCAKVSAADTALGSNSGEIWLDITAGTSQCAGAATLSSNHTLRWSSGGTFITSCSGISISSVSHVNLIGTGGAALFMPNSCPNFSRPVNILSSSYVLVRDLEINGNGSNQASGEQSHDIISYDSDHVKFLNNYLHDAQGDALIVGTDGSETSGCEDVLVQGNTFNNIGRQELSVTGYGCNDVRILGNHFTYGTPVSTSTSRGNPIHIEGDNAGTGFNKITIANNTILGAVGTCISTTSQNLNPIIGLVIDGNQCTGTNSNVNLSAAIAVLMLEDVEISNNTAVFTGATAGTDGILLQEASGIAAQAHRIDIHDNVMEGMSSSLYHITSSATSGTPQSITVHDNIGNNCNTYCLYVVNTFAELDIHDNTFTNAQGVGAHLEGVIRFHFHHNTIRDFGLGGSALNGLELTTNGASPVIGPGEVDTNRIGSAVTTSKIGIAELTNLASNVYVYLNDLTANATANTTNTGFTNGFPPLALVSLSPFTIGSTTIYEDSAGATLAQRNSTTAQQFNVWGSYPSGNFLKLFGNYAGGDPGIQCGGSNCNVNLSSSGGSGSILFRSAYNNGGVGGNFDQNANLSVSGQMAASNFSAVLSGVNAPTVTPTLGTASTWSYKIVVDDASGGTTAVGTAGTTTLGAATLDPSHFNTVQWGAVVAGVCYDVYRTVVATSPNTTGKIAHVCVPSALSVVDNGLAGDGTTAPSTNTTGAIIQDHSYTFANLPASNNGIEVYCSDCKNVVNDAATAGVACVAAGAGAIAKRQNARWDCN